MRGCSLHEESQVVTVKLHLGPYTYSQTVQGQPRCLLASTTLSSEIHRIIYAMSSERETRTSRCNFKRFRKVSKEGAEVTSAGRAFQTRAPATEKARRPTVDSLKAGTHISSEVEDRSLCRDGMSATDVNCRPYCCSSIICCYLI